MKDPCGGLTKASGVSMGTMAAWLQKLPPRIVADRLVDEFFTAIVFTHWLFSSSHKPSYTAKYRELWSCASSPLDNQQKAPVSLSFFGLTCFIICTTLQFLPEELNYLTDNRTPELAAQLHMLGRQALSAAEVEDPPDRFLVEAILMDVSASCFTDLEIQESNAAGLIGHVFQTRRPSSRDLLANCHGCSHCARPWHAQKGSC